MRGNLSGEIVLSLSLQKEIGFGLVAFASGLTNNELRLNCSNPTVGIKGFWMSNRYLLIRAFVTKIIYICDNIFLYH